MAQTTSTRPRKVSKYPKEKVIKKYAYYIEIEAEDYIFFASAEKGKTAETFPLLHNYALTYAFGFCKSLYSNDVQAPTYAQDFAIVNQRGIYIYPAQMVQGSRRLIQYNTTDEEYLMSRGQSIGYPNWGFVKPLIPGSYFSTIILSAEPLTFSQYIRLGKWMALCRIRSSSLRIQPGKRKSSDLLLNYKDIEEEPSFFLSSYHMLPTPLVQDTEWEEAISGYVVTSDEREWFCPSASY